VIEPRRLQVDELVLRPFTAGDEPAVAVALEDPDILRWTAGTAVLRAPAAKRAAKWLDTRIDGWARNNAVFAVADASTDEVLGSVTVREVNRVPDQAICAYWVSPVARGRRIATRALGLRPDRRGRSRPPSALPRPRPDQRGLLPRRDPRRVPARRNHARVLRGDHRPPPRLPSPRAPGHRRLVEAVAALTSCRGGRRARGDLVERA
jgi:hypothetical protein